MGARVVNAIARKFAEIAQTPQYSATNCTSQITKFTATNVTTANATLTVHLVPLAGSAATSNIVSMTRTIAPNETFGFPELVGQVLAPGGFISTIAGTASALVLSASAIEFTNP